MSHSIESTKVVQGDNRFSEIKSSIGEVGDVRNMGEPIRLNKIKLGGVTAHAVQANENVKIWTRLAITSDETIFHRIASSFESVINHHCHQAGAPVSLGRAQTILLVIKENDTAELWVDTAAVAIFCMIKRSMPAGSVIFENDIADVTGMSFPLVNIESTDKVVCIFRQDWRFALFFDFNPDRNLSVDVVNKTLGSLYRNLKYRHLYDSLADEAIFKKLVLAGWFPFVEIISTEFRELVGCFENDFNLQSVEEMVLSKFDEDRLERMISRWITKPHFSSKGDIFRSAINAYKINDSIAVVKSPPAKPGAYHC